MNKKFLLTFLLGILYCSFSFAQDQSFPLNEEPGGIRDSVFRLKTVTVIGARKINTNSLSRINVSLDKLPISVSSINIDQLKLRGIFDVNEAVRFIPGANIRTTYGGFDQLSIRGFDYAPIMVDGIRDERSTINSYPLSDLSDVASIEVLKGPASVLQGHSAVGGALNITRRAPSAEDHFATRIALGSFRKRQATMSLGGKLYKPINYFASINFSEGDGWRNTGNKRFKTYGAIGSRWERSELQIRGGYSRDFYGTEIGLPPTLNETVYHKDGKEYLAPGQVQPGIDPANRYNNESDFMYNTNWNISAKYTYQIIPAGMRLTEHLSYNNDDINYFGTEELSYRTSENPIYPYYVMRKNKKIFIDMDSVQLTFPLRFSHMASTVQNQLSLDGVFHTATVKHNYAAGYAFSFMRRTSFSGYNLGVDVQGPGLYSVISVHEPHSMGYMKTRFSVAKPTRTYSHGFYLQDVMEFSEKFQALAALRYDHYHYERSETEAIDGKRKFKDPASSKYEKTDSQAFTYRLGAVYSPVKQVSVYTSLANFYEPYRTFFNEKNIYINSNGEQFFPEKGKEIFKPKSGYQIELGTRIQINRIFSTQLAGFYIKQNNITKVLGEVEEKVNGKILKKSVIGQVSTIDSKGFELEFTAEPVSGLYLAAGYSLTDAKYRGLKKNPYMETDINEGDPLNNVPKHKWYTYGDYNVGTGFLKGFGVHYSLTYMGKTYRNFKQNIYFDAYTLCNLGATYKLPKGVTLGLDVNNVFNTDVFAQSLGRQLVPIAPTNVTMSITYRM
ncbi:Virulence-associated outer membrane protein Vir-90 [Porphyromonas macacae]|uniref:Virulence-associated outer membrane protein Vir-90 n=1 Tax=Porphyromonas macacae TaxID=28115 RepID=A0A379E8Z6_9PORP|nr:TonB-dependent receptor [Porphyromonas macacae]SUB88821.1 Virulence-associated outer membrane protein Vir-90 [Porphyromonas macacae]